MYGKLPLSFEVNQGQTDPQVKFLSRWRCYTLFLTSTEALLTLRQPPQNGKGTALTVPAQAHHKERALAPEREGLDTTVLRMKLVGANPAPRVQRLDQLPGKSNYLLGNDPEKWRVNVPQYARVKYREVYPGIDLVYYGTNQRQLEYDFVVGPGADGALSVQDWLCPWCGCLDRCRLDRTGWRMQWRRSEGFFRATLWKCRLGGSSSGQ